MNTGLADKRRFILVLGCLTGIAAVTIDMSLPAFPEMVRDLATNMSTGQKVVGFFMFGGKSRCRPDRRYTGVCRYAVRHAVGHRDFPPNMERQLAGQQQVTLIDRDEKRTDDSADSQAA